MKFNNIRVVIEADDTDTVTSKFFYIRATDAGTFTIIHDYIVTEAPDPSAVTSTTDIALQIQLPSGEWHDLFTDLSPRELVTRRLPEGAFRFSLPADSSVTANTSIDHIAEIRKG